MPWQFTFNMEGAGTVHQAISCPQAMGLGPRASIRRGGVTSCCFSPGIDKENVELSPTTGHCNSGRTRHGSASQVQKQRSAGSFKRNSIKKIVWSVLCFTLQTNLTWLLTSDPLPRTAALRVLWSHLARRVARWSTLGALPKFNAASLGCFSFYFGMCLFEHLFWGLQRKQAVRKPDWECGLWAWMNTAVHRGWPSEFPSYRVRGRLIYTHVWGRNHILTPAYLIF